MQNLHLFLINVPLQIKKQGLIDTVAFRNTVKDQWSARSWRAIFFISAQVCVSAKLKLPTNLNKRETRNFVINFGMNFWRNLWIIWKNYLPDTFLFLYFIFLINIQVRLSPQSEQVPTQKIWLLYKRYKELIQSKLKIKSLLHYI